jgi:hypothetical protein
MAQTGFTPIQLYSSSTATNVPLAANLATGELAINITDGKLFYKDNAAAVQVIGWKTVPATAGGTGQTSYAIGDLLYANTTTTLAKLADVATGNALISGGVTTAPSWGKIGLTTHVSGVLPVANGGTGTSSLGPAFSAYGDAIQNLANNTATKVAYNVSVFDTNSNYSTANARFTPTVAGYYQVNCVASSSIVLTSLIQLFIYKNGAVYQNVFTEYNGGAAITGSTDFAFSGSSLVYLNGSSDYIEIYAYASNGGGSSTINGYSARPDVNYFNAVLVRSA